MGRDHVIPDPLSPKRAPLYFAHRVKLYMLKLYLQLQFCATRALSSNRSSDSTPNLTHCIFLSPLFQHPIGCPLPHTPATSQTTCHKPPTTLTSRSLPPTIRPRSLIPCHLYPSNRPWMATTASKRTTASEEPQLKTLVHLNDLATRITRGHLSQ